MIASRRRRVLLARQRPGRAQRVDPRAEQRLVGVDVADARDPALVEQQRLDRRRAPARERAQVLGGEALVERLEPSRAAKNASSAGSPQQQLAGAEAARVDDHQAHVPSPRAPSQRRPGDPHGASSMRTRASRARARTSHRRAGHAQVLGEMNARRRGATPDTCRAGPAARRAVPASASASSSRSERARPARVEDLDPVQPPALHQRSELAPDRLDLGKLGHRRPQLRKASPGSCVARSRPVSQRSTVAPTSASGPS